MSVVALVMVSCGALARTLFGLWIDMLEVEMKFRIEDVAAFRLRLADLPVTAQPTEQHVDTYFRHPVRDFGATDEAFRCRVVDDQAWLTYKGPRLDSSTKSREEIELPLADAEAARVFGTMAERLGFSAVREVRKSRESWQFDDNGQSLTIALDTVPGLGTYCELEVIVARTEDFDGARGRVMGLAERLGLRDTERKSYLCMLLEQEEKK
jgi:adenylate cyclase, class 2